MLTSSHVYDDDDDDGEDDFEDDHYFLPPVWGWGWGWWWWWILIIFSSDLYDAAGNLEPLIEANLQPTFANQGKNMAECWQLIDDEKDEKPPAWTGQIWRSCRSWWSLHCQTPRGSCLPQGSAVAPMLRCLPSRWGVCSFGDGSNLVPPSILSIVWPFQDKKTLVTFATYQMGPAIYIDKKCLARQQPLGGA